MISPEILRRYPYFAGIDEASLRQLAMIAAEKKSIPAAARLFDAGEPVKHLAIIIRGEVNIQYLLGFSALIPPYKYTGFGTTTQETDLALIDACKLRELCNHAPQLGYQLTLHVAKLLAHRLEGACVQLAAV